MKTHQNCSRVDRLDYANTTRDSLPDVRAQPDKSTLATRRLVSPPSPLSSALERNKLFFRLFRSVETQYAESCSSWLTSHKHMMVIPSALSSAVHIILLGFAAWYIRHRAPTSAALLDDHELEYLEEKRKEKEAKKKVKAARKEAKRKAKEEKEKNRKKRGPTHVWRTPGGSSSGSDGESSEHKSSLPPGKDVHTDSSESDTEARKQDLLLDDDDDLEKQTSSAPTNQKELGTRSRRGSTNSKRSSGRH